RSRLLVLLVRELAALALLLKLLELARDLVRRRADRTAPGARRLELVGIDPELLEPRAQPRDPEAALREAIRLRPGERPALHEAPVQRDERGRREDLEHHGHEDVPVRP